MSVGVYVWVCVCSASNAAQKCLSKRLRHSAAASLAALVQSSLVQVAVGQCLLCVWHCRTLTTVRPLTTDYLLPTILVGT